MTVVEPGGMRTDWAGSSMRIDDIRSDYASTVGAVAKMARDSRFAQSEPAKVAEIVHRLALQNDVPVRLIMGSDAVSRTHLAAAERALEDARFEALSRSADAQGPRELAETPRS